MKFNISSTSGVFFGKYSGATVAEAVDCLAQDAGYEDADDMDERTGGSWERDLIVYDGETGREVAR